jgi:cyclopropane-fatty-acyl-phospholipid synthase
MASVTAPRRRGTDEAVVGLHRRLAEHGLDLPVRLWNGRELGPQRTDFRVVVHHPWVPRALLAGGSDLVGGGGDLVAGEAYLEGHLDVEGSMVAALRAVRRFAEDGGIGLADRLATGLSVRRLPAPPRLHRRRAQRPEQVAARLRGRIHTPRRDAVAVRHHYDVGNDFYQRFLDPQMVYSCAVFAEEDRHGPVHDRQVLARAQRRKLELVCSKLRLRPGQHLLDIGCGWGALVLHAAVHHGVVARGVTLSEEQAAWAREAIVRAGLEGRVRVEVADYRELDPAEATYDAVASVGMVEHVGADRLDAYAAHLHRLLVPGGRLLNHGITTGLRDTVRDFSRERDSFVGRYVFPDGALVPAHHMVRVIERAGFELWDVQQLRPHYARTLEHWVAALESEADQARRSVGDRRYRVWRAYMGGSAIGFEVGDLGVVQVLGVRPPHRLPLGRGWMEPDEPPPPPTCSW